MGIDCTSINYQSQGLLMDSRLDKTSSKYRSRDNIIGSILGSAAKGEITKTAVMYSSFLSFPQVNEYLDHLIRHGLLEINRSKRLYKITGKGSKYLEISKELEKMLGAT